MRKANTKVANIVAGSIAQEVGIETGDMILSINENVISDILEYKFLINDEFLNIVIQKSDGQEWEVEIEKEIDEDLGIEFENALISEARSCKNKCIFCFIDQLPKGMRDTLYFKDDDSRLSFLQGNYITLTNLSDEDVNKIIKYRISPLNVSVHTTNAELRVKMLNNKFAGNILRVLGKLAEAGIILNGQIVLCPEVNDGQELDRTLEDLNLLYPHMRSISVVPVGLTKHRQGLYEIKPYNKESALKLIEQVEVWQKSFRKKYKTNFVYIADEFYLMAGKEIPEYREYEDFPQIENGVGLIALFKKEFYDYLKYSVKNKTNRKDRTVSVITGTSSYNFIYRISKDLESKFGNIKINVYKILNNFFGQTVTVTGLITGCDIIEQLKGHELGEELLIPECMLEHGEHVFLDDISTDDIQRELGVNVRITEVNGKEYIKAVLGRSINGKTSSSNSR